MNNEFSLQDFVNILDMLLTKYYYKNNNTKRRISDDLYRKKLCQYAELACQDNVINTFEKEMFIGCSRSIKQGYAN